MARFCFLEVSVGRFRVKPGRGQAEPPWRRSVPLTKSASLSVPDLAMENHNGKPLSATDAVLGRNGRKPETAGGPSSTRNARGDNDDRRRARTVAKQQQAAERIAAAVASWRVTWPRPPRLRGSNAATTEIATGAEEASSAVQESLAAVTQCSGRIEVQKATALKIQGLVQDLQALVAETTTGINVLFGQCGAMPPAARPPR